VQRIGGILRHFQAFFWLRAFSAPQPSPRSAHLPVTHTVGLSAPALGAEALFTTGLRLADEKYRHAGFTASWNQF